MTELSRLIVVCDECSHFFDAADKRCHVSEDQRYSTLCPGCAIERFAGSEAWAVVNDCQGVWTCGIGHSKTEALKELNSGRYNGCECRVEPVRIVREPEDREAIRHWMADTGRE